MLEWILEPLTYPFMQRALIIAVLVGLTCGLFSCFLILKGWSLMGDAVAHAVLPGLLLAYVASIPLAIGAFVAGLFCAVFTGFVKEQSRLKEDAVMGIIFSGMFAIGLVMLTKIESDLHLLHILFGDILGARWSDIIEAGVVCALAILALALKGKDLLLYCFDPVQAKTMGLPVRALHFGLLIFLSLTIVVSLKAAGIILVIAMLIAPGASAFLMTKDFKWMIVLAAGMALISCISGTVLSFHWNVSSAALIVLIQSGFFMVAFLASLRAHEIREPVT